MVLQPRSRRYSRQTSAADGIYIRPVAVSAKALGGTEINAEALNLQLIKSLTSFTRSLLSLLYQLVRACRF